jgi:methyl-accepting chemotaxis protein
MSRFFANLGLRSKLGLYILALVLIEAMLIFSYFPREQNDQARQSLGDKAESLASMLAYALAGATKFEDRETAALLLAEAKKSRDLAFALVQGTSGREIAALEREEAERSLREPTVEELRHGRFTPAHYVTERDIIDPQGQRVGQLRLGFSLDEVHQAVARNRLAGLVVSGVMLVLGLLGAAAIASKVTSPMRRTLEHLRKMSTGDLTERIAVDSLDEAGELAQGVNKMADNVREILVRVHASAMQVAASAEQISANAAQITRGASQQALAADDTSSSMEQIAAQMQSVSKSAENLATTVEHTSHAIQKMFVSIEQVAHNAGLLSSSVQETATTVEEMTATSKRIAKNTEVVNEVSRKAALQASEGGAALSETIERIRGTANRMLESSEAIGRLAQRSQEISKIVNVIEDIADQTNLLALNAAIEAARAGDAGRGFAVVADEVRKLAERSVLATKEISDVIAAVRSETQSVIDVTRSNIHETRESAAMVERTGSILGRIIADAEKASTLITEVNYATQEHSQAAEEILGTVAKMNTITRQVAAAAQEQARNSQGILESVENMNRMTQSVADATSEQKAGGEVVVRAIENISGISRQNQQALEQMSSATQNLAHQAEQPERLIATFKV